jgi:hypothetical protein
MHVESVLIIAVMTRALYTLGLQIFEEAIASEGHGRSGKSLALIVYPS